VYNVDDEVAGINCQALSAGPARARDAAAQVEIESKLSKQIMLLSLQALKP
jgi:hypothetical protein